MIPVDLSAHCESWIYDPNGSGIHVRDPRTCLFGGLHLIRMGLCYILPMSFTNKSELDSVFKFAVW